MAKYRKTGMEFLGRKKYPENSMLYFVKKKGKGTDIRYRFINWMEIKEQADKDEPVK